MIERKVSDIKSLVDPVHRDYYQDLDPFHFHFEMIERKTIDYSPACIAKASTIKRIKNMRDLFNFISHHEAVMILNNDANPANSISRVQSSIKINLDKTIWRCLPSRVASRNTGSCFLFHLPILLDQTQDSASHNHQTQTSLTMQLIVFRKPKIPKRITKLL